ncbi:MAG: stage II sporulation protein M [Polyangiales bacterium]
MRGSLPSLPPSLNLRQQREDEWQTLDALTARALKSGLKSLSDVDLIRLPALYRATLSALAVARASALDRALVDYLEALSVRAYLAIYGAGRNGQRPLRAFLLHTVPTTLRRLAPEFAFAWLIFLLGGIVAFALMQQDVSWYHAFVPPGLAGDRTPDSTTAQLRSVLYQDEDWSSGLVTFASFLFTHNAQVSMLAFALGFAAGVPTVLLTFYNGLILGAFVALYAGHGLLWPLLGWLLPHGVPELTAINLCAAAGLHIGRALIAPGRRRFTTAMRRAGRSATVLVAAALVLLMVAGLFEGILRQSILDDRARFTLAAANLLWVALWLGLRPNQAPT